LSTTAGDMRSLRILLALISFLCIKHSCDALVSGTFSPDKLVKLQISYDGSDQSTFSSIVILLPQGISFLDALNSERVWKNNRVLGGLFHKEKFCASLPDVKNLSTRQKHSLRKRRVDQTVKLWRCYDNTTNSRGSQGSEGLAIHTVLERKSSTRTANKINISKSSSSWADIQQVFQQQRPVYSEKDHYATIKELKELFQTLDDDAISLLHSHDLIASAIEVWNKTQPVDSSICSFVEYIVTSCYLLKEEVPYQFVLSCLFSGRASSAAAVAADHIFANFASYSSFHSALYRNMTQHNVNHMQEPSFLPFARAFYYAGGRLKSIGKGYVQKRGNAHERANTGSGGWLEGKSLMTTRKRLKGLPRTFKLSTNHADRWHSEDLTSEFFDDYEQLGKPVLISGLVNRSHHQFQNFYRNRFVEYYGHKILYKSPESKRKLRYADCIEQMRAPETMGRFYVPLQSLELTYASIINLQYFQQSRVSTHVNFKQYRDPRLEFGRDLFESPLSHLKTGSIVYALLFGRRKWVLYPPQIFARNYTRVENTFGKVVSNFDGSGVFNGFHVLQESGTIVYLPRGWWATYINIGETVGIEFLVLMKNESIQPKPPLPEVIPGQTSCDLPCKTRLQVQKEHDDDVDDAVL
jgi:hypothetical protein